MANELANLLSGVEGRAHHLIQAAPDRALLPQTAQALLVALQRLRTLHSKLLAFGQVRRRTNTEATCELPALVRQLGDELQVLQLGLELRWEPADHLPALAVDAQIAHEALLFLCSAMLRAERGATRLSIVSETCFAGAEPHLQLELTLEWSSEPRVTATDLQTDPTFALDLEAANQLITEHGGELVIHHLPGRSVRTVVYWPIARTTANGSATGLEPEPVQLAHRYGGALVLESDPSVRAMLASELKATGRAVFACADGASARSFLEATPDRFELIIVDDPDRLDGGDALAATIRTVAPRLKVFVLATEPQAMTATWPNLHHIQKPFGVHELRRALASVLAAG